ncbi:hypothetical protein CNMCM8980_010006 [Aspergillus fumigatiaffinis]|uniref:Uncharacterized protein n=1 Tax=Aspergillus fumigatiaffinis TaxID=340414 RepID=A0A8H4GKV3_9EURO|nr:hypothetical protein CNMCM5878_001839 [Aspergillus fumigatiaffinis]KAF4223951.1 hypothetical protein CNMCM6457_010059 [Aspergillus fumigatiaffinis]KAF4234131.1 hypothetical protein CNMCM6805_008837 [Aspergillus fumigatiaffinis]KAF4244560.1 hypothetical protein CNMCM8980_010006 [Aspergillus fumigatiaffinis]
MAEPSDHIEAWSSMESLYDKAIQSPSEITQGEKHAILEWPSLDQMEETSQKYVGKSLQDLIHTAANDPLALTYPECRLVDDDFKILGGLDAAKYKNDRIERMIERRDLWNKWQQARAAVLSPDELKAIKNIRQPEVYLAKQKAHNRPFLEAEERSRTHPPDWVQRILDRDGKGWGYVIYRPSIVHEEEGAKEAWRACWDNFNELLSFHPVMVIGREEIQDSKILDFVDYEPEMGGVDQLRRDFRNRRDKGGLKPGVLSNVFINVPTECRDTYLREDGYSWAWAIDPDWSLPGPDADGYDGRVKVTWGQLFNKFYDLMSTKQVTLREIWEEFHEVNEKLHDGPLPGWLFSKLPKEVWPNN